MHIFSYWIKSLSYSNVRIHFVCAFLELMRILTFPSSVFLCDIIKCALKIGGWKPGANWDKISGREISHSSRPSHTPTTNLAYLYDHHIKRSKSLVGAVENKWMSLGASSPWRPTPQLPDPVIWHGDESMSRAPLCPLWHSLTATQSQTCP